MSDDNKSTTGEFTAETEKGERPLFKSEKVSLLERFQASKAYWQGVGEQIIPSDWPPNDKHVWLSVYVPEDATVGDHDLGIDEPDYRASYASGTLANFQSYYSTTGKMRLTIVPTVKDPRLEGSIDFTAKHESNETTVEVKSGKFTFSGLSLYGLGPVAKV